MTMNVKCLKLTERGKKYAAVRLNGKKYIFIIDIYILTFIVIFFVLAVTL